MKETRTEIVNIANELIKSIGYNAFSYADISKKLNIKNAAIHYYFPSKSDLGVEVIKKNLAAFNSNVDSWKNLGYRQQLTNYLTMHDGFLENYWACIVGALSPSFDTLPQNMQAELQQLVNIILDWLADLLTKGKQSNVFSFGEPPGVKAYMIHSAMLSALLMNKVLKNDIYRSIRDSLINI
jgi:AcrR family transcriptional regulator